MREDGGAKEVFHSSEILNEEPRQRIGVALGVLGDIELLADRHPVQPDEPRHRAGRAAA